MRSLYGAVAVLLVACGGETLDVGNDQGAGGGANSKDGTNAKNLSLAEEMGANPICDSPVVNAPNAQWPDPVACAAAATGVQSDIVGIWEGYAEDKYFVPNLTKKYHLELLAASPGGPVCGTVRVNDGPVPELSDDPEAMYPPLESEFYQSMGSLTGSGTLVGMLDGVVHTIISGGMADNEVRFTVSSHEYLKGWCGLQTAYPNHLAPSGYGCLPNNDSGTSVEAEWTDYTCNMTIKGTKRLFQYAQCRFCTIMGAPFACTCDSCHCTASADAWIAFDLTFNGDQALGPWGNNGGQLRLKRVVQ